MERVGNNILEKYIGEFEASGELEASITLDELIGAERVESYPGLINIGYFLRDGLGVWRTIIIECDDVVIIAAPDGQDDHGISIWYGERVSREKVMEIICDISGSDDIQFMDPYSGEIIDKDISYDRDFPSP